MLGREALALLADLSRIMAEKIGQTYVTRAGLVKRPNCNHVCEIVLTNALGISTPQSPAIQGARLGPGTGPIVGTLSHASA